MRTAAWKLCTGEQGETVLVNVDIVAVMRWVEAGRHPRRTPQATAIEGYMETAPKHQKKAGQFS
jgi:hypothetical protein